MDLVFTEMLQITTRAMEACGVLVIVLGTVAAAVNFGRNWRQKDAYRALRSTLGRAILLGLEVLVAADIINTVAIEPSLDRLAVLAAIVLIRTFLSFSLEVEIEGKWPWHRSKASGEASR